MSNYPVEGGPSHDPAGPPGAPPYQGGATSAFPPSAPPSAEQHWQHQQGYQQHPQAFHGGSRGGRSFNVRSTFKTTEFWIFVLVSIALLIAAAVTDRGDDLQGFGAQEAWKYVTALAIAYILSRGLTKFGGHERDDHRDHRDH